MEVKFTKMQGIGNDYVYVNCFNQELSNPSELAIAVSNRNFGIGSDGLILICPSEVADAKMRMFNLDGSEGMMCGNGIRCVAKYVYDNEICKNEFISIETLSGIKKMQVFEKNGIVQEVKVDMGQPILKANLIPSTFNEDVVVNKEVFIGGESYFITLVSMGNPHCVIFKNNIDSLDLEKIGPLFEKSDFFPNSVNTEFVEILGPNSAKMRVWERGSAETMACGTGACAVAVAATLCGHFNKDEEVTISLLGGDLKIEYKEETVYMTGSAKKVFDGTYYGG